MIDRRSGGLGWRRHRLRIRRDSSLRALSFEAFEGLVPETVATDVTLVLPELPKCPTPLDRCHCLLQKAAEIEHALMVQYLYAAYSLKDDLRKLVAGIAVEEMSHFLTVQNLLLLIRKPPYVRRQDLGAPSTDDERVFPFDLILEPLSKKALAKYVTAESPKDAGPGNALLAKIRNLAMEGTGGTEVNRVGTLYTLLGVIVGTDTILEAAAGGPGPHSEWYRMVLELSTTTLEDGTTVGEKYGHLDENDFDPDSAERQASDDDWDHSVERTSGAQNVDEFRIFVARNREQALAALADIGVQGEGPSPADAEGTHFQRFFQTFKKQFGDDGEGTTEFAVLDVPRAARIPIGESGDPNAISAPEAVAWAQLADVRYALLLGFLEQYLVSPPGQRALLVGWSFAEMFHLKTIGTTVLVRLPRSTQGGVAALPFTQVPDAELGLPQGARWPAIHAMRLSKAIQLGENILGSQTTISADTRRVLQHMIATDRRKLVEAEARHQAQSERTRFDRVREILDAASGVGSPSHSSSTFTPQGRFWNVTRDVFIELMVHGHRVVETSGDARGSRSALVKALRGQQPPFNTPTFGMPQNRPKVAAEDVAFIERWIDDGCPDDPL